MRLLDIFDVLTTRTTYTELIEPALASVDMDTEEYETLVTWQRVCLGSEIEAEQSAAYSALITTDTNICFKLQPILSNPIMRFLSAAIPNDGLETIDRIRILAHILSLGSPTIFSISEHVLLSLVAEHFYAEQIDETTSNMLALMLANTALVEPTIEADVEARDRSRGFFTSTTPTRRPCSPHNSEAEHSCLKRSI